MLGIGKFLLGCGFFVGEGSVDEKVKGNGSGTNIIISEIKRVR